MRKSIRTEQQQLCDESEAQLCTVGTIDSLPSGLLNMTLEASDRIVFLAPQLIENVTSNLAETYMGIWTYFDGGKLFNHIQSSSFEARCYAAGLRFQGGTQWCLPAWENYVGNPAPECLQCLVTQTQRSRQKDKDRKSTAKYTAQRRKSKYQSSEQTSTHYGPNAAQPDLPRSELDKICQEYKHRLNVSDLEQSHIEQQTKDQANDETGLWYEQRRSRLTASNFGRVAKRRSSTPSAPLVKQLLYSKHKSTPAMRWGQQHEQDARETYRNTYMSSTVTRSGLVIDKAHGWLACSPDDLVTDPCARDSFGVVGYKCPYSAKETNNMEEASKLKNFPAKLMDGKLVLKCNHNYYYQVQGCMAICRSWCDFVIWTPQWTSVERINYDSDYWEKAVPSLQKFYDYGLLPELASPRHPFRQPNRELLQD